ncbi:hypothetical protein KIN20_013179 [Parelaphostrongylus tenuis]|uniref:Uncharacterized protein n=1 Tax=Parelaphostrongylus tenuis TaxID=148309 RepID=A0AAD5MD52_PARTN|nr:hypothetical protein KIN20_013179 [Parelaphostrongylus tenuis]
MACTARWIESQIDDVVLVLLLAFIDPLWRIRMQVYDVINADRHFSQPRWKPSFVARFCQTSPTPLSPRCRIGLSKSQKENEARFLYSLL